MSIEMICLFFINFHLFETCSADLNNKKLFYFFRRNKRIKKESEKLNFDSPNLNDTDFIEQVSITL